MISAAQEGKKKENKILPGQPRSLLLKIKLQSLFFLYKGPLHWPFKQVFNAVFYAGTASLASIITPASVVYATTQASFNSGVKASPK